MPPRLIMLLTAPARSGKDAIFSAFQAAMTTSAAGSRDAGPVRRYASADVLRDVVSRLTGVSVSQMSEPHLKNEVIPELGVSGRDLLITLGTTLMRNHMAEAIAGTPLESVISPPSSLFAWATAREIYRQQGGVAVVTDVRFQDEVDVFTRDSGALNVMRVLIVRPSALPSTLEGVNETERFSVQEAQRAHVMRVGTTHDESMIHLRDEENVGSFTTVLFNDRDGLEHVQALGAGLAPYVRSTFGV